MTSEMSYRVDLTGFRVPYRYGSCQEGPGPVKACIKVGGPEAYYPCVFNWGSLLEIEGQLHLILMQVKHASTRLYFAFCSMAHYLLYTVA